MNRLLLSLLLLAPCLAPAGNLPVETQQEIAHLFTYLRGSGCEFNRNGTWYGASEAASHLNQKYDYLLRKNLISSTEDFIQRSATESSMSGKPYLVRCGQAHPVESGPWFKAALAKYRSGKR